MHAVLTVVHTAAHTYRTHAPACREKSNCVASLTVLSIERYRAIIFIYLSTGGHCTNAPAVVILPLQVDEDAPAYFDKDGHALVGKTFFNPREKPNLMSGTSVKFTVKVPPFFDGKKSWFTYEDEILDWQEITEIPPEKRVCRGPLP